MRMLLLLILMVSMCFGEFDDTITKHITYVDSQILTHEQLNFSEDSTQQWSRRVRSAIDTLSGWGVLMNGDSTFTLFRAQKINSDSIMSNSGDTTFIDSAMGYFYNITHIKTQKITGDTILSGSGDTVYIDSLRVGHLTVGSFDSAFNDIYVDTMTANSDGGIIIRDDGGNILMYGANDGNVCFGGTEIPYFLNIKHSSNPMVSFIRPGDTIGAIGGASSNELIIQGNSSNIKMSSDGFATTHFSLNTAGQITINGGIAVDSAEITKMKKLNVGGGSTTHT